VIITGAQVKAARALLGWTQLQLAKEMHANATTVKNFEAGKRRLSVLETTVIRRILEAAGVEFIAENGGEPGVKLRRAG
jgi:transcriptional regulator with XRE-family HTH domain